MIIGSSMHEDAPHSFTIDFVSCESGLEELVNSIAVLCFDVVGKKWGASS